jgi:hypothetical protein
MSGETIMVKVGGLDDDGTSNSDSESGADEETEEASIEQHKAVVKEQTPQEQGATVPTNQDKGANKSDGQAGSKGDDNGNGDTSSHSSAEDDNQQQIFYVHKKILCKTSIFFQNATKPEWSGPLPRPIDLTDENPRVFQAYLHWLYSQQVATETKLGNCCLNADGEQPEMQYDLLGRSYLLGEKLMDSTYQDAVMKAITHTATIGCSFPGDYWVRLAYKRTTASSPLRKILVDFWVWAGRNTWVEDGNVVKNTGKDFAKDVIAAFFNRREPYQDETEDRPWVKDLEAYNVKAITEADEEK